MNRKYPYWLYEDTFNRTKDAAEKADIIMDEGEYESMRMNKKEWNVLTAFEQDFELTMLEEEGLHMEGTLELSSENTEIAT